MRYSFVTSQTEAEQLVASMKSRGWNAYWMHNRAGCFEVRGWK